MLLFWQQQIQKRSGFVTVLPYSAPRVSLKSVARAENLGTLRIDWQPNVTFRCSSATSWSVMVHKKRLIWLHKQKSSEFKSSDLVDRGSKANLQVVMFTQYIFSYFYPRTNS